MDSDWLKGASGFRLVRQCNRLTNRIEPLWGTRRLAGNQISRLAKFPLSIYLVSKEVILTIISGRSY